ncbi:hypothetical protein D3C80_1069000 [compost metagenome]
MLGQHRQGGQVQGQGAVLVVLEVKTDLARALDLDPFDIGELGAVLEVALTYQQIEGETYIFRADGLTIGKAGMGVEVEAQPVSFGIPLQLTGDQPINGVGLILGAHGQGGI